MQRFLYADATNDKTEPRDRAQVARAWDALEERKRILRMKPKPKDVDVSPEALAKCRKSSYQAPAIDLGPAEQP